MKELSIEEKAKRYDEAFEIARLVLQERGNEPDGASMLSELFPELIESEDERIELLNYLYDVHDDDEERARWIAWLEKQGENNMGISEATKQKLEDNLNKALEKETPESCNEFLDDKAEPKFKVGNWYQCTKDFFGKGVTFDKNTAYYCAKEGCLQNEYGCHIAIVKDLYDNFKLWTIQDAKDGDVLYCKNSGIEYIVMNKGVNEHGNIDSYFRYNSVNGFGVNMPSVFSTRQDDITPATEEQRDLLFQKMHEAGYEWDAEKKELKKIEQKPEENPLISLKDFQEAFELKARQYDIELPNRGYDIHAMCKELYSLLIKQNPAWSEEDWDYYAAIIAKLEVTQDDALLTDNQMEFLKSIKNRFLPQPKQEWSEEDEKKLSRIYSILGQVADEHAFSNTCRLIGDKECVELQDWLKTLEDRYCSLPKHEWNENEL